MASAYRRPMDDVSDPTFDTEDLWSDDPLFRPLTPEEAERAYAEAPEVPMTEEEIQSIVDYVVGRDRDGVRDAET